MPLFLQGGASALQHALKTVLSSQDTKQSDSDAAESAPSSSNFATINRPPASESRITDSNGHETLLTSLFSSTRTSVTPKNRAIAQAIPSKVAVQRPQLENPSGSENSSDDELAIKPRASRSAARGQQTSATSKDQQQAESEHGVEPLPGKQNLPLQERTADEDAKTPVENSDHGGGGEGERKSVDLQRVPQSQIKTRKGKGKKPKAKSSGPTPEELARAQEAEDSESARYMVECIRDHAFKNNRLMLRIHWEGYETEHDTWEPERNLQQDAPEVLLEYFQSVGGRPVKNKAGRPQKSQTPTKVEPTPPTNRKRPLDEIDEADLEYSPNPRGAPVGQSLPPPTPNAWDDFAHEISDLTLKDDKSIVAAVTWLTQDNKGNRHSSTEAYWRVRCAAPKALMEYYERNISFGDNPPGIPDAARFPPEDISGPTAEESTISGPTSRDVKPKSGSKLPARPKQKKAKR